MRTPLLVDLHLGVEVDAGDKQVADNVESAHTHEDVGVFKGDLLADLHHNKNDHEVGAALPWSVRRWATSSCAWAEAYIWGFMMAVLGRVVTAWLPCW